MFVLELTLDERYDLRPAPPLIKMWLDKSPMIFLVVAAVMFIVGLNVFVYTANQVQVRSA